MNEVMRVALEQAWNDGHDAGWEDCLGWETEHVNPYSKKEEK